MEDKIKIIGEVENFTPYDNINKNCIKWVENNLLPAGNCSLDIIEFWNRVVSNVDVEYVCEIPEIAEFRPEISIKSGTTLIGRKITEFGRPGLHTYFGIPYALKPIGQNRFKRPLAANYENEIDCGIQKKECVRTLTPFFRKHRYFVPNLL